MQAQCQNYDGRVKDERSSLHLYPLHDVLPHVMDEICWCEPMLEVVNGRRLYHHFQGGPDAVREV